MMAVEWTGKYENEIRQRCEAATEGPWETSERKRVRIHSIADCIMGGFGRLICYGPEIRPDVSPRRHQIYRADGVFIANARKDLPAALDEISCLRKELVDARAQFYDSAEDTDGP